MIRACQRDERHLLRGPDYLMYEIADNLVSDFLPCVDALDEEIDPHCTTQWGKCRVEEEVFHRPTSGTLSRFSPSNAPSSICAASCRRSVK